MGGRMKTDTDQLFEMAKGMNNASRSGSNYGKLFLLKDILMELNSMNLGIDDKVELVNPKEIEEFILSKIINFLENKKAEIKKDIEKESKFPDPYLDKL
jgi:hypothetical protein